MIKKNKLIIFWILSLCIAIHVFALRPNLRFNRLTVDDGLSHNIVHCMLQDSKGFMWFGTNSGLNRFDGYEFVTFGVDSGNTYQMSDDYILCLYEDSHDQLWISTGDGVDVYNRETTQFIHYNSDPSSQIQLSDNNINSIIEDNEGMIWIANSAGFDKIDPKKKTLVSYRPANLNRAFSLQTSISKMYIDKQGKIWFGTSNNGLGLFDPASKSCHNFRYNKEDVHSISSDNIISIHEDVDGNMWIGTSKGGLNFLNRAENKFYRYIPDSESKKSLTVKSILDDEKGNIWIGTLNGIYLFNKKTRSFENYVHDSHDHQSIGNNNVQALYKDKKGDFWLGTKMGVNFVNATNIPFVHYRVDTYTNRCLNNGIINGILEDRDGDLWIATNGGGLNRLNPESGLFTYYTHDPNNPGSIYNSSIKSITEDKDGNLWFGTKYGGLSFFNRAQNRFYQYKINPDLPMDSQPLVTSLYANDDNTLWISISEQKILLFHMKDHRTQYYPLPEKEFTPQISAVYKAGDGTIWIGGKHSDLHRIDNKTKRINYYPIPLKSRFTIILSILEDRNKNLWIGTNGSGLVRFDNTRTQFKIFTQEDGLPNNHVQSVIMDKNDILWLGTDNGLVKFNPETKDMLCFYRENGLQSNQFRPSAVCMTRSGRLLFGGINGVTAFYPNKIERNSYIPPVVMTDFLVFNQSVPIGGVNPIIEKSILEAQKIRLSYKQSSLAFEFSALNYANSKRNQYTYIMEGFDKEWNYVGNQRMATYMRLDPGEYLFHVKASNNDGVWNETGNKLMITITPPFWALWWFRTIAVLTAFLIVISVIRLRVSFEKKARRKERTFVVRIIQDLVHQLNNSSVNLANVVEECNATSKETSASVQEIAEGMNVQSKRFKVVMEASQNVSSAAEEVSQQAQHSEETTKKIFESTMVGGKDLDNVFSVIESISKMTSESTQTIVNLGEKSTQINNITEVITDISDQTNLLALNARIQAAQAGKYGAGFNVVAGEISKLSKRTNNSSNKIVKIVNEILDRSDEAVDHAQQVSEEVESGKNVISTFGDKLKSILKDVEGITDIVHGIFQAADMQRKEMHGLSDSIGAMAVITDQVTEGSKQISCMIAEENKALNDMSLMANDLKDIAQNLETLMEDIRKR